MAVDVEVQQLIQRPPAGVAAFVMDPANDRAWIRALSEVRVLTDGPVGPGTRVARSARFLGRTLEYVNEIVEYEPPHRLAMRSVKAPFPMTVRYSFEPAGAGTRVVVGAGGEPGRFYGLARPLLEVAMRRAIGGDLERLRSVLEA